MRSPKTELADEQPLSGARADERGQPEAAVLAASGQRAVQHILEEAHAGEPTPAQKISLRHHFEHAKTVAAKCAIVRRRFGVTPEAINPQTAPEMMRVRTQESAPWDEAGLEKLWTVLERLPYADLAGISTISRHKADHVTGQMEASTLAIGFASGDEQMTVGEADLAMASSLSGLYEQAVPSDVSLMAGDNKIEKTLTHEIGHNVARQLGAEEGYCATSAGGGWQMMRTQEELSAMLGQLGLAQHLGAEQIAHVGHWLYVSAMYWEGEFDAPRILAWWPSVTLAAQAAVRGAFDFVGSLMGGAPHYLLGDDAQVVRDGRVYQFDANAGGFMSYELAARARRVSNYQMKGPGEWFAEAYAAYYAPDLGGQGALLAKKDPETKRWFDENAARRK